MTGSSSRWSVAALTARALGLGLATALPAVSMAQAEEPPKKPSLWQRLKTEGVQVKVGRDGITTGPAQRQAGQTPSSGASFNAAVVYRGDSTQALYTGLAGAGRLGGLFAKDDVERRQKGLLDWPRAAVTFNQYGPSLECWEGTARIWSSASNHQDEKFQLCNAPGVIRDAFGREGVVDWQVVSSYATQLRAAEFMEGHTGTQRTLGPKPPQAPFGLSTVTLMQPGGLIPADDPLDTRMDAMLVRLAWATGYLVPEEMEGLAGAGFAHFSDARLWVVGFDPKGLQP